MRSSSGDTLCMKNGPLQIKQGLNRLCTHGIFSLDGRTFVQIKIKGAFFNRDELKIAPDKSWKWQQVVQAVTYRTKTFGHVCANLKAMAV